MRRMRHTTLLFKIALLAGVSAGWMAGQDDASRLAEIAAKQEAKAAEAKPPEPNKIEKVFLRIKDKDWVRRFTEGGDGLGPKFGGLAPGTGFGIGARYKRSDLLDGRMKFAASATTSLRGDRKLDVELTAPKLARGKVFTTLYTVRHDYGRMQYYGSGPDSEKTGRTNFRLEDTAVDGTIGVRPMKPVTVGASAGYLFNNIGPGQDSRFASADQTYTPRQAPGIDIQSNYMRTGAFAQYDWRDNPDGPRRGGNYFAQVHDYRDQSFGTSDFRRLDLEAQQYIPVLNQRRVFALRARSAMTWSDRPVPFYMQPSLGGGDDLRGFRPFRFRGDNLILMNAEYRWEIFSGLDMAVFADAGKVYDRKSEFSLSHLESSVGFGFRANERNRTFLRVDVAFSHEGFQVWVKFNNLFQKGPVKTSSSVGE
jgi:outer membrane protein assembly factor BamA